MQNAVFNITERTEKGKKVRMKGEVPAIMYGQSLEKPIPCQITKRELIDLLASDSSVLSLKLNDKVENCVLKEVQRDAFGNIVHLDFQYVKKGDSVKLKVPVRFAGTESLDARRLLLDDIVIGDVYLKNIDLQKGSGTLSIVLIQDCYKEKGYDTAVERTVLEYGFKELGLSAIYADVVLRNTRSQHVLEKIGFEYLHEDS